MNDQFLRQRNNTQDGDDGADDDLDDAPVSADSCCATASQLTGVALGL